MFGRVNKLGVIYDGMDHYKICDWCNLCYKRVEQQRWKTIPWKVCRVNWNWLFRGDWLGSKGRPWRPSYLMEYYWLTHTCKNCELVCANNSSFRTLKEGIDCQFLLLVKDFNKKVFCETFLLGKIFRTRISFNKSHHFLMEISDLVCHQGFLQRKSALCKYERKDCGKTCIP